MLGQQSRSQKHGKLASRPRNQVCKDLKGGQPAAEWEISKKTQAEFHYEGGVEQAEPEPESGFDSNDFFCASV